MGTIKPQKVFVLTDRLELYRDFSINLLYTIHDYYLDKSTLCDEKDISNHFKWCFLKVNEGFKKENINFNKNFKVMEYLFSYYKLNFYENLNFKNKDEIDIKLFVSFWNNIFNTNLQQQDAELAKILIELYLLFDVSINERYDVKELI